MPKGLDPKRDVMPELDEGAQAIVERFLQAPQVVRTAVPMPKRTTPQNPRQKPLEALQPPMPEAPENQPDPMGVPNILGTNGTRCNLTPCTEHKYKYGVCKKHYQEVMARKRKESRERNKRPL